MAPRDHQLRGKLDVNPHFYNIVDFSNYSTDVKGSSTAKIYQAAKRAVDAVVGGMSEDDFKGFRTTMRAE
ncbi:hypothetical protein OQA88_11011 [Cercophora sp. LCS_1]